MRWRGWEGGGIFNPKMLRCTFVKRGDTPPTPSPLHTHATYTQFKDKTITLPPASAPILQVFKINWLFTAARQQTRAEKRKSLEVSESLKCFVSAVGESE